MKPQNKTAAIIGVGQIGGSLGLALKKSDFFEKIYGYDKNTQQLKLAETFLDKCFDDIEETVKNSDIIILASPINSILETLRFGFENFPQKLYTDVGSTKFPMLKLSSKYSDVRYIGGHPLAGSEKKGESGWEASLFIRKPYFWTSDENQSKEDEQTIVNMIRSCGAKPISLLAEEHDRAVAMTSHLPLIVSLAMMSSFSEREEQLTSFLGSGFQSMTRLSGGSPQMGKDLLISNQENIVDELEIFSEKLSDLKKLIKNDDEKTLLNKMKSYQDLYWKIFGNSK